MEVSNIASLATSLAQTRLQQEVGVSVLKKAMDAQASTVLALLQSVTADTQPTSLPAHLGQHINTTA